MTPTLYELLLRCCGLTDQDAAKLHQAPRPLVERWRRGREPAPQEALQDLAALALLIGHTAIQTGTMLAHLIDERGELPGVIEFGLVGTDQEAHDLGWPCVNAQAAVIAATAPTAVLDGIEVRIRRGARTPTTAAADAAHDSDQNFRLFVPPSRPWRAEGAPARPQT